MQCMQVDEESQEEPMKVLQLPVTAERKGKEKRGKNGTDGGERNRRERVQDKKEKGPLRAAAWSVEGRWEHHRRNVNQDQSNEYCIGISVQISTVNCFRVP